MEKNNPMLCDPDSGICAVPGQAGATGTMFKAFTPVAKPITVLYFTDPICSACWCVEPALRKLTSAYGGLIDLQTHMGGLLPGWEGFNDGGMTKPADIAPHWEEMGAYFHMPMLGDVWLEDPLMSSYPPSIAFKAAELQDKQRSLAFLRRLRELVITEKKNITKWRVIAGAATDAGLDTARLHADFNGAAPALFQADLTLARSLGVRGFPTFIFTDATDARQVVYGARPYANFEAAVKALVPDANAAPPPTALEGLFALHASWCAEEVAVALGITHEQAKAALQAAEAKGALAAVHTRNGSVWRRK
ncbi:MAG: DsbA family protein [Bacteroidetes bacterium]|nr:DsbA family protein [Bacteroidota bacterium]